MSFALASNEPLFCMHEFEARQPVRRYGALLTAIQLLVCCKQGPPVRDVVFRKHAGSSVGSTDVGTLPHRLGTLVVQV